ncbi:MAG: hypothetical protein AAGF11_40765 [Myxococcota bacterium]
MMARLARNPVLVALIGSWTLACAPADTPTADPEAAALAPPVLIVDEPPAEDDSSDVADQSSPDADEAPAGVSPSALAKDPQTEVITFDGADAEPGMSDEVTGAPKREPLPSMMSDVLHGPNK